MTALPAALVIDCTTDSLLAGGATVGNASLMAFTRALGGSSLDDNIRVVGVNPGPVDTDRIYSMLKKRANTIKIRPTTAAARKVCDRPILSPTQPHANDPTVSAPFWAS